MVLQTRSGNDLYRKLESHMQVTDMFNIQGQSREFSISSAGYTVLTEKNEGAGGGSLEPTWTLARSTVEK